LLRNPLQREEETVGIGPISWQILRLTERLPHAHQSLRNFLTGGRAATGIGLCAMALLTCSNLALAKNPVVTSVAFTGTNIDLHVVISGTGFGSAPPGVPCPSCTTPFLRVMDGRGDICQVFNIASWTDTQVTFSGVRGDPGDPVLVLVENPQNHRVGFSQGLTIPKTITLASPIIKSVSFAGGIGQNLQITIVGSGFGASPPHLPFEGDLPFFTFLDRPFEPTGWEAGYSQASFHDTVTVKFESWSSSKIVIRGFGGDYGKKDLTVSSKDPIEIWVTNSGTCGLSLNSFDQSPASIAAIWGGHLP
jgi:hypothetical protein